MQCWSGLLCDIQGLCFDCSVQLQLCTKLWRGSTKVVAINGATLYYVTSALSIHNVIDVNVMLQHCILATVFRRDRHVFTTQLTCITHVTEVRVIHTNVHKNADQRARHFGPARDKTTYAFRYHAAQFTHRPSPTSLRQKVFI